MIHLTMSDLPPYTPAPIRDIPTIHKTIVSKFHTHTTKPLAYRQQQLRTLYWALKDAEPTLLEALHLDLGKSSYEAYMTEVGWALNDIIFMERNLARFMKDEPASDIDITNSFMRPRIRKDPLGAVLILGAYNFPLQLTLGPLVGAIAAGCTAVLKPSEQAPNAARVLLHVLSEALDQSAYRVVLGGVPETQELLECKWDKIFYTGNSTVATIIARTAAETLTPVTLELGGRNPAIITRNANPRLAARRLLWAKLMNAGQVCVSQNYIIIDRHILPKFVEQLEVALKEFLPEGVKQSKDYARIVNERQWNRLKELLDSSGGNVLMGGASERETLFFEPTVMQVESKDDVLLREESFGPLIPLLPVEGLDEAIRIANEVHATPLGLYAFGTAEETERILAETRSGGASINDGFYHASIPTLAFGGVGDSGQGAYRGRASFDCFSHRRSIITTPSWVERLLDVRYPPYSPGKFRRLRLMTELRPGFDRRGRSTGGLIWWVLGLGAKGRVSALVRWFVVVVLAVAVRMWKASG